jgi:uncharacterized glyoxalase superfamily protein PhnB
MTQQSPTGITRIEPYLYYEDVDAAVAWLEKAFGFRPTGERMRDAAGVTTHAAMEHDGGVIMMGKPSTYENPKRPELLTSSLYVHVSDIEAHCARAKAAGAQIIEDLNTTEYGHRRYGVQDPQGQHWYFAQPIPA